MIPKIMDTESYMLVTGGLTGREPRSVAPASDLSGDVWPGGQRGPWGGQAGVDRPAPADRLAVRPLAGSEPAVGVWWLGVHGGAGESTLEQLFSGSQAAGHAWPVSPPEVARARVVLVARTNARGLRAAQYAIRDWVTASVAVRVLGLVLIADAPGRLPRALRDQAALVGGGVPSVWWLPWVQAWRAGQQPAADNAPGQARRLLADLRKA